MTVKLQRTGQSLLLCLKEVQSLVGISDRKWRELEALGLTPKPVRLPGRSLAKWRRADIEEWVRKLKA